MNGTDHNLRIRPIDPSHVADLIRIGEETNLSPWTARHYLDELKDPNAIMLRLVSDDNSTIGFVVGRKVLGGEHARFDAEIYNIAITISNQNRGNGQHLLDAFLDECRDQEIGNIWLEVRESNAKAIRFYAKNGFEPVQTRNNFYENPREPALLMRLILKKDGA